VRSVSQLSRTNKSLPNDLRDALRELDSEVMAKYIDPKAIDDFLPPKRASWRSSARNTHLRPEYNWYLHTV
jgi:glutamine synthetase